MNGARNCSIVGAAFCLGFELLEIPRVKGLKVWAAGLWLALEQDEHVQAEDGGLRIRREHNLGMTFMVLVLIADKDKVVCSRTISKNGRVGNHRENWLIRPGIQKSGVRALGNFSRVPRYLDTRVHEHLFETRNRHPWHHVDPRYGKLSGLPGANPNPRGAIFLLYSVL